MDTPEYTYLEETKRKLITILSKLMFTDSLHPHTQHLRTVSKSLYMNEEEEEINWKDFSVFLINFR